MSFQTSDRLNHRNWNLLLGDTGAVASLENFVVLGDGSGPVDNELSVNSGVTWAPSATATLQATYLQRGSSTRIVAAGDDVLGPTHNWLSTDGGQTWTLGAAYALPVDLWAGGCFGNATWLLFSHAGDLMTSADGLNWTVQAPALADIWSAVWTGSQFIAGGTLGNLLQTSPTGVVWTARATFPFTHLDDQCLCLGVFGGAVIAGSSRSGGAGSDIYRSVDNGANWTNVYSDAFVANPVQAAASPTAIVIAWSSGGFVYRSTNGTAWAIVAMPVGGGLRGIAYHNGAFIAVNVFGRVLKSTDDGLTWAATDLSAAIGNGRSIC